MIARGVPGGPTKADAPWKWARREVGKEEGHVQGEQNLPTERPSADAYDDRAMLGNDKPRLCRWSALDQRRAQHDGPMPRVRREGRVHTKASQSRHALAALAEWLDGEGVFEAFEPCFHALQLPLLLLDEQGFNLAQS